MIPIENWIAAFLVRIQKDPRISIVHIGIFSVMAHCCVRFGREGSCIVYRSDLMQAAKISSASTYYKILKELSDYGYIGYYPSRCPLKGSLVTLLPMTDTSKNKILNTNNRHENKNENDGCPFRDSERILLMQ